MKITFLGQGFEEKSTNAVGNYLMNYLSSTNYHSFTGISAFASESGIYGLAGYLSIAKKSYKNLTLIVGVDLEGTSKEALEEILGLNIASFIFYQKEQPVFHPKIYLFEGDKEIKLIIGSSNLTRGGLFTNVESSMLIEFASNDKEGLTFLTQLKTYYKSLFDFSDTNLYKISSQSIIEFYSNGIIPDETTRRNNFHKKVITATAQPHTTTSSLIIQKRITAKVPSAFATKPRKTGAGVEASVTSKITTTANAVTTTSVTSSQPKVLLWESRHLTRRDLTIPKKITSHSTGSMLFKKGITTGIEPRIYFRHQVFHNLAWILDTAQKTAHIERSTAFFRIIILGVDQGVFPLKLSHNTKTDTISYIQNNSMTSLSWGKAKPLIANPDLIGKSVSLYTDPSSQNQFILEID